jgi:heptosyltransferase-2
VKRLVIAPNWVGDAVMSLPVLRAVRRSHPHDELTVLARRGPAAIYRAEGSADEVLERSSLAGDAWGLRRRRFEEAWLLPNSFRAALLVFLAGIPRRLGYATDRRAWLLTDALQPPTGGSHQLRDYDALLAIAGIPADDHPPRLPVPEAASARAREALAAAGLSGQSKLVLLCPGSAFARTKRWPPERFASLARGLREKGYACGVAIGPGERELGARVALAAEPSLAVLGEDLDPVELAAVFAAASLVVSNDSGPMHLAGAVGTPVVAFFGPTDPGRTGPIGSPSVVLDRYVFCSPCFKTECPYGHECMQEITVEMAARAVMDLVAVSSKQ